MRTDRLGKAIALELAAGRVAVGAGAAFAPEPTLRVLGFDGSDGSARAIARVLGARDLALAALTLAVRNDSAALRTTTLAGAALDAGDALAFGFAARDPQLRRAALASALSAVITTAAGAWSAHRLSK